MLSSTSKRTSGNEPPRDRRTSVAVVRRGLIRPQNAKEMHACHGHPRKEKIDMGPHDTLRPNVAAGTIGLYVKPASDPGVLSVTGDGQPTFQHIRHLDQCKDQDRRIADLPPGCEERSIASGCRSPNGEMGAPNRRPTASTRERLAAKNGHAASGAEVRIGCPGPRRRSILSGQELEESIRAARDQPDPFGVQPLASVDGVVAVHPKRPAVRILALTAASRKPHRPILRPRPLTRVGGADRLTCRRRRRSEHLSQQAILLPNLRRSENRVRQWLEAAGWRRYAPKRNQGSFSLGCLWRWCLAHPWRNDQVSVC